MTNGEKLIEIFPNNTHITLKRTTQFAINPMTLNQQMIVVDNDFWNAEYEEPTTKNCESCRYNSSHHGMCKYCYKCSLWTEQEPTTKNDLTVDLISRADALALYCDKCGLYNCISKCASYRAVEKMPSVTPQEPKKGHWIGHREHCENLGVMPSGLGAYEWCSNCDCGIDVREWHRNHYNYCPNCGADMREVEEC